MSYIKTAQMFVQRNVSLLTALLFVFLVFSLLFLGSRVQSHSFYFQDETDHIAMGWMMVKFDKQLYVDLSTNHQPIPVLLGALLSNIITYETLYELIARLRLSLFLFSLIASVLLTIRFKWVGGVAASLTYSLGYLYFAWYLLAESLVAPAVLFMTLLLIERLSHVWLEKKSPPAHTSDVILFGVAACWSVFSLLPIVPFVALAMLLYFFTIPFKQKQTLVLSCITGIGALLIFINPIAWYEETIHNNWLYWLESGQGGSDISLFGSLAYPFLGFGHLESSIARSIAVPLVMLTVLVVLTLISRRSWNWRVLLLLVTSYTLISIANLRVDTMPVAFYSGFHLFPYLGALFGFFASLTYILIARSNFRIVSFTLAALVFAVLIAGNMQWVFEEKEPLSEYYIQYGFQASHASAMKLIARPGDTFFSAPNGHGYLNMMSELPIAGRQLFHLQWAYRSPKLRSEFHELMEKSPPTFIYLTEDESGYHTDLRNRYMPDNYSPFFHNGSRSQLYIHSNKLDSLSSVDIQNLADLEYVVGEYDNWSQPDQKH